MRRTPSSQHVLFAWLGLEGDSFRRNSLFLFSTKVHVDHDCVVQGLMGNQGQVLASASATSSEEEKGSI
jgi:hypothetical protein